MTSARSKLKLILIVGTLVISLPHFLHAQYVDPGTGSYVFQILTAGLLALLFYSRQLFGFAKSKFSRLFQKGSRAAGDKR